MGKIHSHYDNLKVSRDAPQAVIKAAYRTLSQQYHPDLAKEPDAARIMGIINKSYAILSDPTSRKEHDVWLETQEKNETKNHQEWNKTENQKPAQKVQPSKKPFTSILRALPIQIWLGLGFLIFIWIGSFKEKPAATHTYTPSPSTPSYSSPEIPRTHVKNAYERPLLAPNGEQWPSVAGYLANYTLNNTGGLSTITIDNTRHEHDVYVKLVSLPTQATARHVYIPKHSTFTIRDISVGNYEIRYKNLDTGNTYKADIPVKLEERSTYDGVEYSNMRMTLYQVANGNMQTPKIPEEQF